MPKPFISEKVTELVLKRDKFKCQKCGFLGMKEDLELHPKFLSQTTNDVDNLTTLCSICKHFAPTNKDDFEKYLDEKIDNQILDTFRNYKPSISKRIKRGMEKKSKSGKIMARAPFGYKVEKGKLIPDENAQTITDIFRTFLDTNLSLTQIAQRYKLSINGLKKVLTNYSYLGKVKFAGQIIDSDHTPLVSAELFNQVQDKLKTKGISI